MSGKTIDLHELYKMRGDIALAALEILERDLEAVKTVLEQVKNLDRHYQLKEDLDSTGVSEIIKVLRAHNPAAAEGKTDAEVLAMFGRSDGTTPP